MNTSVIERRLRKLEDEAAPECRYFAAFMHKGEDGLLVLTHANAIITQRKNETPEAFDTRIRKVLGIGEGDKFKILKLDRPPRANELLCWNGGGMAIIAPKKEYEPC